DAVGTMVAAAASRFGCIDILVNNAAVRAEQALETMTLADWRAVTGVILDGAFNCVKACLPHLKQSGAGAIVNIGGLSAPLRASRRGAPPARGDRQGRARRLHPRAGARARPRKDQGEHGDAGRDGGAAPGGAARAAAPFARACAGGPARRALRHRRSRALPL